MDKMRWVSLGHIRYFFSGLYVGPSTRYRYRIMVLNRVMVLNKFILVKRILLFDKRYGILSEDTE